MSKLTDERPMTREDFQEVIGENLPAKALEANLKAFDLGVSRVNQ